MGSMDEIEAVYTHCDEWNDEEYHKEQFKKYVKIIKQLLIPNDLIEYDFLELED